MTRRGIAIIAGGAIIAGLLPFHVLGSGADPSSPGPPAVRFASRPDITPMRAGARPTRTPTPHPSSMAGSDLTATADAAVTTTISATLTAEANATATANAAASATIAATQTATEQTAEAQQTATANAAATATAAAQATSTEIARQTSVIAAVETYVAEVSTQRATATAVAAATATAEQQTVDAEQSQTAAAQQTADSSSQATSTADAQRTMTAQQTAVATRTSTGVAQSFAAGPTSAAETQAAASSQPGGGTSPLPATPTPTGTAPSVLVTGSSSSGGSNAGATVYPILGTSSPSTQASTARGSHSTPTVAIKLGATRAVPALESVLTPDPVQPGGMEHLTVSFVERAIVEVKSSIPNRPSQTEYKLADDHGRSSFDIPVPASVHLTNGRATADVVVAADDGLWKRLGVLTTAFDPGAVERISVKYAPRTFLRAVLNGRGRQSLTVLGRTDDSGHAELMVPIPRTRGPGGFAVPHGQVDVSVLLPHHRAQQARRIEISDFIVNLEAGTIQSCREALSVTVSYKPRVPVIVTVSFPHNYQLSLRLLTDTAGASSARVRLSYNRAVSPVRISAVAHDARLGSGRSERTAISIRLPHSCSA